MCVCMWVRSVCSCKCQDVCVRVCACTGVGASIWDVCVHIKVWLWLSVWVWVCIDKFTAANCKFDNFWKSPIFRLKSPIFWLKSPLLPGKEVLYSPYIGLLSGNRRLFNGERYISAIISCSALYFCLKSNPSSSGKKSPVLPRCRTFVWNRGLFNGEPYISGKAPSISRKESLCFGILWREAYMSVVCACLHMSIMHSNISKRVLFAKECYKNRVLFRKRPGRHQGTYGRHLCCSVLQCVAVCCSVLQWVSARCSVLQCVALRCSVLLQCVAVCGFVSKRDVDDVTVPIIDTRNVKMCKISDICLTHMNVSCHTCEQGTLHTWTSHVTHVDESCHTYEWVMSNIWTRHGTHMNESCHTYE